MRYYAQYDENNKLLAIGTGCGGTEISKEQYDALYAEIRSKGEYVYKLYKEEISINDVPQEWQEEIQNRVNEMIERQNAYQASEISANEFYSMVEAVM